MLEFNKKFIAALTAGTIAFTLCSCAKGGEVVEISNKSTLTSTLNAVSDFTTIDENLESLSYVDGEGNAYDFDALVEKYHEARKGKDLELANSLLYQIGIRIAKASLAEQLDIDCKSITSVTYNSRGGNGPGTVSVKYNVTKVNEIPGGLQESCVVEEEKTIYADGELANLMINVIRAKSGRLTLGSGNGSDLDNVYKSFERYMLTSGVLKDTFGNTELTMELDDVKVKAYKKSLDN